MTTWIEQLHDQQQRINEMDAYVTSMVIQARLAGDSWTAIGKALGVSKQAVHRKYSRLLLSPQQPVLDGV